MQHDRPLTGGEPVCHHRQALPQLLHIVPNECFIVERLLTATNTFSNDDDRNANICTGNYNGCHEPQQIDYILSSDHSLRSRTFDSSATSSDHWTDRHHQGETWETEGKRHARKPIGWECRDHIGFNNTVRAQLKVGSGAFGPEPRLSDNPSFRAVHLQRWIRPGCVAKTEVCWMGLHGYDEASSTWGQGDGGGLWTSANQHG